MCGYAKGEAASRVKVSAVGHEGVRARGGVRRSGSRGCRRCGLHRRGRSVVLRPRAYGRSEGVDDRDVAVPRSADDAAHLSAVGAAGAAPAAGQWLHRDIEATLVIDHSDSKEERARIAGGVIADEPDRYPVHQHVQTITPALVIYSRTRGCSRRLSRLHEPRFIPGQPAPNCADTPISVTKANLWLTY